MDTVMVPRRHPWWPIKFSYAIVSTPAILLVSLLQPSISIADSFRFFPDLGLTEYHSDNVALTPSPLERSGWISNVAAGLRLEYKSAKSNASLDYHFYKFFYSNDSARNTSQNLLNSAANIELVDKWLFIDAHASISQQNRSPFGYVGGADTARINANRVETLVFQASPYIKGRFSDLATYQVRLNAADSHTKDSSVPNTRTDELTALLKSTAASGKLGWSFDTYSLAVRNNIVGSRRNSRVRTSISYELFPQLHFSALAGYEFNNYLTTANRENNILGAGIEWKPTERTQLAAVSQRRFFGNDHVVAFGHRTPLTAWRIASSRDISIANGLFGSQGGGAYNLMFDLLASSIPDPVARAEAASRRLQTTGISADTAGNEGFLTPRPYLNRRDEASLAMLGTRNTLVASVGRSKRKAIDPVGTAAGPATNDDVNQRNASLSWAYRITPLSSLTLTATSLNSESTSQIGVEAKQKSYSVFYLAQIGPHTNASVGLRNAHFDSTLTNSYQENSFVCAITAHF